MFGNGIKLPNLAQAARTNSGKTSIVFCASWRESRGLGQSAGTKFTARRGDLFACVDALGFFYPEDYFSISLVYL